MSRDNWQHAQIGAQVAQLPAAQIRNLLPFVVKGYQSESAQKESFLKDVQTSEAQARAQELLAQIAAGGTPAMQDVRDTNLAAKQAQGQPLSADEQAFMKGYEQRKTISDAHRGNKSLRVSTHTRRDPHACQQRRCDADKRARW